MASSSATASAPSSQPTSTRFLFQQNCQVGSRSSLSSTASSTPLSSRPASPQYLHGVQQSSCGSDTDERGSLSPLIRSSRWDARQTSNWWSGVSQRRRRRHSGRCTRTIRTWCRRIVRHPFSPTRPITLTLTAILFSIFAVSLTLFLIYILNPDKEALPWRAYCSFPSLAPPRDTPYSLHRIYPELDPGGAVPSFPPSGFDSLPPAGIFVGVFSVDLAFERRMLARTTWASHLRSRNGAVGGDGGRGTSRTIVRFILGQPRPSWERRINLEMQTYNDIIIIPSPENMNSGKTHTFFSWASLSAWVPPVYTSSEPPLPLFSYLNYTASSPPLAPHDPPSAWANIRSDHPKMWVRPDFLVKADDDSFIMLAELEARLRVELHYKPKMTDNITRASKRVPKATSSSSARDEAISSTGPIPHAVLFPESSTDNDPLVYWGYLVTNRHHQFMAGEMYALSWSLVDWIAKDATVKTMTRGAEDKQTAKWMRLHPNADKVRWTSERCWVYDHPRSGTVYAHGFLFPSEVARIKHEMIACVENAKRDRGHYEFPSLPPERKNGRDKGGDWYGLPPETLSRSSVSKFGFCYTPSLPNLSVKHSIEALVEGSQMSMLRPGVPVTPKHAWMHREGRNTRYQGSRVGGTVVVHFIKKDAWYLETALALLEGEEESDAETYWLHEDDLQ